MRTYRSGTAWCFWRWTEVDSGYITRLHFIKTPFGAIDIHWINHPDVEPYLHDHPVTFLSIILKGWYMEQRSKYPGLSLLRKRRWYNFIRASKDDRHTITAVSPGGAITLCFMGPKTREWGFHVPNGPWVHWKAYYNLQRNGWIS